VTTEYHAVDRMCGNCLSSGFMDGVPICDFVASTKKVQISNFGTKSPIFGTVSGGWRAICALTSKCLVKIEATYP
jgi:hypothetical protein